MGESTTLNMPQKSRGEKSITFNFNNCPHININLNNTMIIPSQGRVPSTIIHEIIQTTYSFCHDWDINSFIIRFHDKKSIDIIILLL